MFELTYKNLSLVAFIIFNENYHKINILSCSQTKYIQQIPLIQNKVFLNVFYHLCIDVTKASC